MEEQKLEKDKEPKQEYDDSLNSNYCEHLGGICDDMWCAINGCYEVIKSDPE